MSHNFELLYIQLLRTICYKENSFLTGRPKKWRKRWKWAASAGACLDDIVYEGYHKEGERLFLAHPYRFGSQCFTVLWKYVLQLWLDKEGQTSKQQLGVYFWVWLKGKKRGKAALFVFFFFFMWQFRFRTERRRSGAHDPIGWSDILIKGVVSEQYLLHTVWGNWLGWVGLDWTDDVSKGGHCRT